MVTRICSMWWLALVTLCVCGVLAEKVWYEKAPPLDDPCTIHVIGRGKSELLDAYSDPECTHGGLIWYGTWGRIHGHLLMSMNRSQEFEVCLTAGLAETVYVWWDSHRDYWQPIGFQQKHFEVTHHQRCRPSTNGSADIYFEAPWAELRYIAYVSWELRPLTKTQHKDAWIKLEKSRRPGAYPSDDENDDDDDAKDNVENKEYPEYFVVLLSTFNENLFVIIPVVIAAVLGHLFCRLRWKASSESHNKEKTKSSPNQTFTKNKLKKPVKREQE